MLRIPSALRPIVPATLAAVLAACGYSATPVSLSLTATNADGGSVRSFDARGIIDPAASRFDDGALLHSRWEAGRAGTGVVELLLDLNRAALAGSVRRGDPPVTLSPDDGDLRAMVRQRRPDGTVLLDHAPGFAQVVITAWVQDGQRELASGSFVLELPAVTDGLYAELGGQFLTDPAPPGATVIPTDFGRTDTGVSDPGQSDPRPIDPITSDPGPTDNEAVFDEGCACPGPDTDDDLPEDEPGGDGGESDSGGCDCGGDEPAPDGDPDDGDADAGGCDCGGDEPTPDGDSDGGGGGCQGDDSLPDGDSDGGDTDSGGCDCAGDEDPEPTDARRVAPGRVRTAETKARAQRRRGVCHRSPGRIALEVSPILLVYLVRQRQRRRR